MIFCVGHQRNYEIALMDGGHQKIGRCYGFLGESFPEYYCGGSVWETYQEAKRFCLEERPEWDVFGVEAIWGKDTEASKDGQWHDLLVDADLVPCTERQRSLIRHFSAVRGRNIQTSPEEIAKVSETIKELRSAFEGINDSLESIPVCV